MLARSMVVIKIRSFVRNGSFVAGPDKYTNAISMMTFMKELFELCSSFSLVLRSSVLKKKSIIYSINRKFVKISFIGIRIHATYKCLMWSCLNQNQNIPHIHWTRNNEIHTGILKHLKIAIQLGTCNAFGAIIQTLSKKYGYI